MKIFGGQLILGKTAAHANFFDLPRFVSPNLGRFSKALKKQSIRGKPALQDEPVPNTTAAEN
jgi:hypothetical protein